SDGATSGVPLPLAALYTHWGIARRGNAMDETPVSDLTATSGGAAPPARPAYAVCPRISMDRDAREPNLFGSEQNPVDFLNSEIPSSDLDVEVRAHSILQRNELIRRHQRKMNIEKLLGVREAREVNAKQRLRKERKSSVRKAVAQRQSSAEQVQQLRKE